MTRSCLNLCHAWPTTTSLCFHNVIIVWGGRAMLVAVVARGDGPLALASWPAAWNFFASGGQLHAHGSTNHHRSYSRGEFQTLLRFAMTAGLCASGFMIFLAFSGAGGRVLLALLGNQQVLYATALPVRIGCLLPLLVALQNVCQASVS